MSSVETSVFSLYPPWTHITQLLNAGVLDLSFERARILDLGCGSKSMLWLSLLATSAFGRYVGVDEELQQRNFYDEFISFRNEGFIRRAPNLDRAQFNERIQLHTEKIEAFLAKPVDRYDLVVLSDILHLNAVKGHWQATLEQSLALLGKGGYGYIKIITAASPDWNYQSPFNQGEIDKLSTIMPVVHACTDASDPRKTVFILHAV